MRKCHKQVEQKGRHENSKMSGEGQYREQAKKQWEKLDAEGHKIISDLLVADKDRTVWPENTEPKFTRKKGAKLTKVVFDTKSKKYTHTYKEKEEVPIKEAIRLDIPDAHIYFCFHPTKNECVMIDAPNRQEPDTKNVVTAPLCHWIWERSITVSALLSYTIRITHSARSNVQRAIKNAHLEEVLQKKNCRARMLHRVGRHFTRCNNRLIRCMRFEQKS